MKVLLSWLREFVPIALDPAALCERLTTGGLEVESVEHLGAELAAVVVAEIVGTTPHPHAERLTVCDVRTGSGAPVAVVCGATNMRPGDRVAYAPPGATLPGGRRIEHATIRGVASAGMLCSATELGIPGDATGILILAPDAPLGQRVAAVLGEEDVVLDIGVTPNRGDCLSVLGIAREIAALTGVPLLRTRSALRERGDAAASAIAIRIEDPGGCPRYAARVVRGVTVGPSPRWVQRRLEAVGLRSINNVVDVTNLVMIERGQPLHAFDYARLARSAIVVRRAHDTRSVRTLDGSERRLAPDDLLITTGAEPIAIAGVMGGADTEVRDDTTTVLLESACFDAASIRRTARRLEIRSEASYRFERGVDVEGVAAAADRAAALVKQLAGGEVLRGLVDVYPRPSAPAPIALRPKRVEEILGTTISRAEMTAALKALGAGVTTSAPGTLAVSVPSYRNDLKREIDLIEEIARLVGYERIPASMPAIRLAAGHVPPRLRWERELKRLLAASGLSEAVTVSFTSAHHNAVFPGLGIAGTAVEIANPLARDQSQLRRSLLGGLVDVWRVNRNHGARSVAVFSVGRVFWRADEAPDQGAAPREAWRMAALLAGELPHRGLGGTRTADFADVKGVVESVFERLRIERPIRWLRCEEPPFHPGASATVSCDGERVGVAGALHPDAAFELDIDMPCWLFELDTEKVLPYCPAQLRFVGLPRFPAVARDVALVVDEDFASERVVQFVRQWRAEYVEDVGLFDRYAGPPIPSGKKSLAYTISYRAADRTLTDDEVNGLHAELIRALTTQLGVELRQ